MVSVIIISFNTKEITLKCLDHLLASEGADLEVIVVDNSSFDGSAEAIAEKYPQIKLVVNKKNTGFARANNQGMGLANGEYLLLLNSDCFVDKDTIKKILASDYVLNNSDVIGIKLLNTDGSIQHTFGYFPTLFRVIALMLFIDNLPIARNFFKSIHVRDNNRYLTTHEADWVMGAFVFLKRRVWENTRGLDEKYFMYGEEMEWMYRIKAGGMTIRYFPGSKAYHIGGASSPNKAPAIIGEMVGWKYWFGKYYPPWQQKILPFFIIFGCMLRMVFKPKLGRFYREAIGKIRS